MATRGAALALLLAAGMLVAAAVPLQGAALGDGEVLGSENWEAARGLLPDEILEHYRVGEYRNAIMDPDRPGRQGVGYPPDFVQASKANRGRYALSPAGSLVEAASGRAPAYVMGLPFPDVDEGDPQAATKIVWNYFYAIWYRGDFHFLTELVMFGRRGVERRIATDVLQRMYDGAPEARGRSNPKNLVLQTLATVVSPADLNGTVSLSWRHRDPGMHDSVWTYVPGLRRPRQVSPLNRSDGFLGSDLSQDDGPFFDGKPEDFTYRLLGRQDQLVLFDPWGIGGEAEIVPAPGGGWRTVWKDAPRVGADDPSWQGLPWAPISSVLVRRPVWVVEAVSRDPNYLYGKIVLRFDAEWYRGSWSSKYDQAGRLVASYQVSAGPFYSPDGKVWIETGGVAAQIGENHVYRRATVVLFPPRSRENPADYRVSPSPDLFSPDVLVRAGR